MSWDTEYHESEPHDETTKIGCTITMHLMKEPDGNETGSAETTMHESIPNENPTLDA
jgi:hypothetical protein